MASLFNLENPVMQFLGKAFDVMVLSLLWVIFSLPIITIGASTTALYYVILKIVKDEDSHFVRLFLSSFFKEFKPATKLWSIMLLIIILLGLSTYLYVDVVEPVGLTRDLILGLEILLIFIWCAMFTYVFPVLARFENTWKQVAYNAFTMSIANLGSTVLMLVADAVILYLSFRFVPGVGIGAMAWFNAVFLHKIFNKYTVAEEDTQNEELCE